MSPGMECDGCDKVFINNLNMSVHQICQHDGDKHLMTILMLGAIHSLHALFGWRWIQDTSIILTEKLSDQ
jgi:hypothetical protein